MSLSALRDQTNTTVKHCKHYVVSTGYKETPSYVQLIQRLIWNQSIESAWVSFSLKENFRKSLGCSDFVCRSNKQETEHNKSDTPVTRNVQKWRRIGVHKKCACCTLCGLRWSNTQTSASVGVVARSIHMKKIYNVPRNWCQVKCYLKTLCDKRFALS